LAALNKFKTGDRSILIATDVASRGLDIPNVDLVINFDIPSNSKDYIHRVGRTARAGAQGRALTIVTQYDIETLQKIETLIGKQLDEYGKNGEVDTKAALMLSDSVAEATRIASMVSTNYKYSNITNCLLNRKCVKTLILKRPMMKPKTIKKTIQT
jgi:ATP-dependent RNA helicase DDX47/RRP3